MISHSGFKVLFKRFKELLPDVYTIFVTNSAVLAE